MLHSAYPMLRLVSGWLLAVSLALFATVPVTGQDLVYAAVQLSAKISVHGSAGSASLSVTNRSSFNNQTVSLIRAELLRGLQSHGWKFDRPQQNEASIAITLAETYRNYVWTAQVMKAGSPEVSIVELPKSTESGTVKREPVNGPRGAGYALAMVRVRRPDATRSGVEHNRVRGG